MSISKLGHVYFSSRSAFPFLNNGLSDKVSDFDTSQTYNNVESRVENRKRKTVQCSLNT